MGAEYGSLEGFLQDGRAHLAAGPVALVLVEDAVEIESTLRHHLDAGFRHVIALAPPDLPLDPPRDARASLVRAPVLVPQATEHLVNRMIAAAPPGTWLYYCYNAEYLFHPFCEHRSVAEMLTFAAEERRDSVLTYVIDLYADDLDRFPAAVSIEDAHLDRTGYYALARSGNGGASPDRQLDFFGGLRWRFEEHVPAARRRIDRVALFRTRPGLQLQGDHTFNIAEYNTYACPWHNSITAALCSFRTAKALMRNPGSRYAIRSFRWHNSAPFQWHSRQLLDLGLMEPGQWF